MREDKGPDKTSNDFEGEHLIMVNGERKTVTIFWDDNFGDWSLAGEPPNGAAGWCYSDGERAEGGFYYSASALVEYIAPD